jgi:hypothetical protein
LELKFKVTTDKGLPGQILSKFIDIDREYTILPGIKLRVDKVFKKGDRIIFECTEIIGKSKIDYSFSVGN